MRAALEMVVTQNGAADDGEVGVGSDEIVRDGVDEIEQTAEGRSVDMHGAMMGAHGDAVLVKVRVWGVLQPPTLTAERDGDDAQILACGMRAACCCGTASGIPFVFYAELTGRVFFSRGFGGAGGGDIARVLFGLGEIDGDLEIAPSGGRLPLDVASDGRAAYVTAVAAHAIEPIGSRGGFVNA